MPAFDLAAIRMLVLDVDGILTDGTIWIDDDGRTSKRFSIVDGAGIVYWQRAGLKIALISGHAHEGVVTRFRFSWEPRER